MLTLGPTHASTTANVMRDLADDTSSNPLADQLATLDVHPINRSVLDRITKRFSHVDEQGCIHLHGWRNGAGRPKISWHGRKCAIARIIVALRDDLDIW